MTYRRTVPANAAEVARVITVKAIQIAKNRCLGHPTDVLEGNEKISAPEIVDVYQRDDTTLFSCEVEMNLSEGYSEDKYADDFQKATHLLAKDMT